jgi:hypothetical protein
MAEPVIVTVNRTPGAPVTVILYLELHADFGAPSSSTALRPHLHPDDLGVAASTVKEWCR